MWRYKNLVSKAAQNPEKAAYKVQELAGAIPARVYHGWQTEKLPNQCDYLDRFRNQDEYLLIILDACRCDVFTEVAPEYLAFESIKPMQSEGRNTFEYVSRCWDESYDDVAYVSAATPVNSDSREEYDEHTLRQLYGGYVPSEHLSNIRDVWRESWDESIGITPPAAVTDAALEADSQKIVAHYFQPHAPYIGRQSLLGHTNNESSSPREGEPVDAPVWEQVKYGDLTRGQLYQLYESNLRRALREVCRLVEQIDNKTVAIMGDHGEALGEYWSYGHSSSKHPYVRTVPWGIVDKVTTYPDGEENKEGNTSVTSRLEDLGYLN